MYAKLLLFVCVYRRISAHDLQSTMGELGMTLTSADVHAMMKQAGVGPEGKIYFQGKRYCKPPTAYVRAYSVRNSIFLLSSSRTFSHVHVVVHAFISSAPTSSCTVYMYTRTGTVADDNVLVFTMIIIERL